MPWQKTDPMKERMRFVALAEAGLFSMTDLCERFGIARKSGYKWKERFDAEGPEGLIDRNRAPHHCPQKTSDEVSEAIIEMRRKHPSWGPRKLLRVLEDRRPELHLPAPSTAGVILAREGLVSGRPHRQHIKHPYTPAIEASEPNAVWTVDFKGEFRTGNGVPCYPLTIVDHYSRYLLGCRALPSTATHGARAAFERLFRDVGLPAAIRSDNGIPFASNGIYGLTTLSVWWIQLGIRLQRTMPRHPEQNGAHERMHRTLKAETARPPARNLKAQQRRFDEFRIEYNTERPHEAIGQCTPATLWAPSPRPYPERLPEPSYPGHFEVRHIKRFGEFKLHNQRVFLSTALAYCSIGLEETDDGIWSIYFCDVLLGRFDERTKRLCAS
jgi:transposase InsO family protein